MKKIIQITTLFFIIVFFVSSAIGQNLQGPQLDVIYFNIGQGDASIVLFPNGKTMLVDAGPLGKMGRDVHITIKAVKSLFELKKIDTIDIAVLTHPHADHLGAYPYLLNNYTIKEFWDNNTHTASTYRRILKSIEKKKVSYLHGFKNINNRVNKLNKSNFFGKNIQLIVLGPLKHYHNDELNSNSICLKLIYNNISYIFLGDASIEPLDEMAQRWQEQLSSQIIMIPHHGSHNNYSEIFLNYVLPEIAICSAGKGNSFGHPHQEVLFGYHYAGVQVLRTDSLQSHIKISTDGDTYSVSIIKKFIDKNKYAKTK